MTFTDLFELIRDNWRREEGQTMAEYGVVLAVITIACLVAFTALSGGITKAIDKVVAVLPT
jgi:Flp pilus assembly pilin Flp